MQTRTRFTLLELLTVMAIIAVLAALLLPALVTARETAQAAVCTNSMRQLGLGICLYGSDFDGHILASDYRDGTYSGGYVHPRH